MKTLQEKLAGELFYSFPQASDFSWLGECVMQWPDDIRGEAIKAVLEVFINTLPDHTLDYLSWALSDKGIDLDPTLTLARQLAKRDTLAGGKGISGATFDFSSHVFAYLYDEGILRMAIREIEKIKADVAYGNIIDAQIKDYKTGAMR